MPIYLAQSKLPDGPEQYIFQSKKYIKIRIVFTKARHLRGMDTLIELASYRKLPTVAFGLILREC